MLMLAVIFAYLLGSIPSGLLLGKIIWQVDLREHGSRNIGATNAWRTLGKKAGISVFFADFMKGVGGVFIAILIDPTPLMAVIGGMASIMGHTFSIFLNFKGGKGVATALGVIAMLSPTLTLILFTSWLVIVYFTGYVSLASIIAGGIAPVASYLLDLPNEYQLFMSIAAVLVIIRHKANIERLSQGTEIKIKSGKIK